jgi:hypothetical protein
MTQPIIQLLQRLVQSNGCHLNNYNRMHILERVVYIDCIVVALNLRNYIHLDVYSFGVVLFEIFERELPWVNVTNAVVAHNILSGKTLTVSETSLQNDNIMKTFLLDAATCRQANHSIGEAVLAIRRQRSTDDG